VHAYLYICSRRLFLSVCFRRTK